MVSEWFDAMIINKEKENRNHIEIIIEDNLL